MERERVRPHIRDGRPVSGYVRRKRAKQSTGPAVAAVVGCTIALGGGGTATLDSVSALKSRPARSSKAGAETVELRTFARLESKGYRINYRSRSQFGSCRNKSYGRVHRFFGSHPCRWLHRFMAEISSRRGVSVLVAVSVVDMPDTAQATEYKHLVDIQGSGNITELPKEMYRYRHVEFTGHRYSSAQHGTLVANVQVEPRGRTRSAAAAAEVAQLVVAG